MRPDWERGITSALAEAVARLDGEEYVSTSVRMGTVKLNDGRHAEIHVFLSTNRDDFPVSKAQTEK